MKNVFKKLFSLMLVAVMLVSVLPMTAMAAEGDPIMKVNFIAPDGTVLSAGECENEWVNENYPFILDWAEPWLANVENSENYKIDKDNWTDVLPKQDAEGKFVYNIPCLLNKEDNMTVVFLKPGTTDQVVKSGSAYNPYLLENPAAAMTSKEASAWLGENADYEVPAGQSYYPTPSKDNTMFTYYVELAKKGDTTDPSEPSTNPEEKRVSLTFTAPDGYKFTTTEMVGVEKEYLTANEAQAMYDGESDYRVVGATNTRAASEKLYLIAKDNTCKVELELVSTSAESKDVKLYDYYGEYITTITLVEGKYVPALPEPAKISGYRFDGWYDGDFYELFTGRYVGDLKKFSSEYTANYKKSVNDGVSDLTIKVALYSNDKFVDSFKLGDTVTMDDGTPILKWLLNDDHYAKILKMINSDSRTKGYQWEDEVFYERLSNEKLTGQLERANGDQVVYIRLDATDDIETKVILYVHNKVSSKYIEEHVMTGYVKDGEIDRDDVWDYIKDHYKTSSKTKLDGLYSERTWKQKVAGQDPDSVEELDIDTKGYYEVHVILTNASSKADSSNPKTGDSIFMTVTVMTVSVTALAVLVLANKKRMVK